MTAVVPVFTTVTGSVLEFPILVVTFTAAGEIASEGRGSAIPAQPVDHRIAEIRRLRSTRTLFSRNTFMWIRSPLAQGQIFLIDTAFFRSPEGGSSGRLLS